MWQQEKLRAHISNYNRKGCYSFKLLSCMKLNLPCRSLSWETSVKLELLASNHHATRPFLFAISIQVVFK